MTDRLVALGDSFSCGEGVGLQFTLDQTWVGLLSSSLGLEMDIVAAPGETAGELRQLQLAVALERSSALATLLVGLNDTIRLDYDAVATRANIAAVVTELCAAYPVVLVGRWHDPLSMFTLPSAARTMMANRIGTVNLAIDEAIAANDRAVCLDLGSLDALRHRWAWAVDRIHPSLSGHRVIAAAAAHALRGHFPWQAPVPMCVPDEKITAFAETRWAIRHGAPWLAQRLRKAVLPAAANVVARNDRAAVGEPGPGGDVPRAQQLANR